jgi:hypothetical protein
LAEIPYDRLQIPDNLQEKFRAGLSKKERLALARAVIPMDDYATLGVCYLLLGDDTEAIATAARKTMLTMPTARILGAIDRNTHPKVMEFLAEFRTESDNQLAEALCRNPAANDRTVRILARSADASLCEAIASNQTRMLLTPDIYTDLAANPACPPTVLSRVHSFLRMQRSLPEGTRDPHAESEPEPEPEPEPEVKRLSASSPKDLEAEIEAALAGRQSPALQKRALKMFDLDQFDEEPAAEKVDVLGSFDFDFQEVDDNFSWDLTTEREDRTGDEVEETRSLEGRLKDLSVGQLIKLAFKGNKEVRSLLLRNTNKSIASAVIKSGRMTDGEIVSAASNRNLADDVIRTIAGNKEFLRKYPVKVALVNNSKTPVPTALSLLKSMHKKDLKQVSRNHNVSSIIANSAKKLFKQKFQKG